MTFSMDAFAAGIDLAAVLLLALGIKGLSKVSSARGANGLAALAMGLAVVGLLIQIRPDPIAWLWIAAGSAAGGLAAVLAKRPQRGASHAAEGRRGRCGLYLQA